MTKSVLAILLALGLLGVFAAGTLAGSDRLSQYDDDANANAIYGNDSHNPHLQAYLDEHQYNPERYDNLPLLQSAYHEPHTALQASVDSPYEKVNYERLEQASSFLERQFMTLTDETPLQLGALPHVGRNRGAGTRLPDPIGGLELKPPKREVMMDEVHTVAPTALYGRTQTSSNVLPRAAQKMWEESRVHRGHGALQDHHMGGGGGFANGQMLEQRHGAVGRSGNRQFLFRVPELKKGRNQHAFAVFPNAATMPLPQGHEFGHGTAPLGELRLAQNSEVREWGREGVPQHALGGRPGYAYDEVNLRHTNRVGQSGVGVYEQDTDAAYRGIAGVPQGRGLESRREVNMYVRPNKTVPVDPNAYRVPSATNKAAAYINQHHAPRDLTDRLTNRTVDEQSAEQEVQWY